MPGQRQLRVHASVAGPVARVFGEALAEQLHRADDETDRSVGMGAGAALHHERAEEVDALRAVLGMKRVMTVDELRRGVEAIPETEYHRLTYYRRWIRSIADNLLTKGVITETELRAALDRV